MNKKFMLASALLLSLAGCGGKKKVVQEAQKPSAQKEIFSEVDIPLAGDGISSFFDEDLKELAYTEAISADQAVDFAQIYDSPDLAWSEMNEGVFKTVYFDFDSSAIRADQEDVLAQNVKMLKKKIKDHERSGKNTPMTIVVEGHACDSAGSRAYNFAKSEERAKIVKDRLVAAGIAPDMIKIVGRGQEIPAIINGRPVEGDRESQWPNRRDEIRVIYA